MKKLRLAILVAEQKMSPEEKKKLNRMLRLKRAINAAKDAIKEMDSKIVHDNKISELKRVEAVRKLCEADAALEVANQGDSPPLYDIPTRMLFSKADKHESIRIGKFFHGHPDLLMLGDVADTPWDQISFLLRKEGIECPLALSKFHAEYRKHMDMLERAAAPTAPAPLSY